MKTIEERAVIYADEMNGEYNILSEELREQDDDAYIRIATEQKAIDEEMWRRDAIQLMNKQKKEIRHNLKIALISKGMSTDSIHDVLKSIRLD